jgi:hypothetical protein
MCDTVFQTIYELNSAGVGVSFPFACGIRKRVVLLDKAAGEMFGVLICKVAGMLGDEIQSTTGTFAISKDTTLITTFIVDQAFRICEEFARFKMATSENLVDYSRDWIQETDLSQFDQHAAIVKESFDIFINHGLMKLDEFEQFTRISTKFPVSKFELLVELFEGCQWWWRAMGQPMKDRLN